MKREFYAQFTTPILIALLVIIASTVSGQTTSTVAGGDGNWNTAANWNNGVPGTGFIANVNKALTINTNISVTSGGEFNINSPATDNAGAPNYTLTLAGAGMTYGLFDVFANTVFGGALNVNSRGDLVVEPGCTLTVGAATFANNSRVNVKAGGTLIINGNFSNNNNSNNITVNGALIVNGNISVGNGSTITGTGNVSSTGSMTGAGTIYGSSPSCGGPNCSSATTCANNTASPAASSVCSGNSPGLITGSNLTSYTYRWQSSSSAAGPWTNIHATLSAANRNYTPGALTSNTYFRRQATLGGCTTYSTPLLISVYTYPVISNIPTANMIANYRFNGNANDAINNNNGTLQGAPTATTDRFSLTTSAYTFNGTSQHVSTANSYNNPTNFTVSAWINTTSSTGGKIIGFGDSQTGQSGTYDRHVYMDNFGKIFFGVYPNAVVTINSGDSYNDGNWHLVTASLSSTNGMSLYVDGSLVASNSGVTTGQTFTGYWKIGFDNLGGWTNQPASYYFNGKIDDVLIYSTELTAAQVYNLYYNPDGAGSVAVCEGGTLNLTATTSSGSTYAWTGPNSFSSSTQNPTVTSMSAVKEGVYRVIVTNGGTCSATAYTVGKIDATLGTNISQVPISGLIGHYKLNGNARDAVGTNHGSLQGGPTVTTDRYAQATSAYTFNGSTQFVSTANQYTTPGDFTVSVWFNTTTAGGKLIGFGNSQTGTSGQYDRHVYMSNSGQIYFGVYPGAVRTINSTYSYNDGSWHLVTASLSSSNGMRLYMDGVLVASDASVTAGENYNGYWKIGYDNINYWTDQPTNFYFTGKLDDVQIYSRELTAVEVTTIYRSPDGPNSNSPVCTASTLTLSAPTVANVSYAWTGPNSYSSSTQNPTVTTNASAVHAGSYQLTTTNSVTGCINRHYAYVVVSTPPNITAQPASITRCVGTAANFSVTATGSFITYQWRKNSSNLTGAATNSYNIAAVVTGDGGNYDVIVTSGGCNVTSNTAVLTATNTNQWNGSTSTDWFTTTNWSCGGVPTSTFDVNIPTGLTLYPVISAGNTGNGRDINIASGASITLANNTSNLNVYGNWANAGTFTANGGLVTIAATTTVSGSAATNFGALTNNGTLTAHATQMNIGGNFVNNGTFTHNSGTVNFNGTSTLSGTTPVTFNHILISGTLTGYAANTSLAGNFTNNGTYTHNSGTVVFGGTSAQSIGGSSTTTFNNITLTNTNAAVSLAHNENLIGTLTLNNNTTFTATGFELVLISNASGTGRIGAVPASATYNGNIRMERYVQAKSDRLWYSLTSCVNGSTVAQWQTNASSNLGIYVTGPFSGASAPGNGINPSGVSSYKWDPAAGTWNRFPNSDNNEAVSPGVGHRVFIRDGNATYNGGVTSAKTFSIVGTPVIGNHVFNLSYSPVGGNPTGGWNLIGNPYPSDISADLSSTGWINATNMDGLATYTWDSDGKSYVSCNGGIGTCTVPSSQGFWVKVLPGGGSITATESVKVTGSTQLARVAVGQPNYIPVRLVNGTTSESDVLYLRFENDATDAFDNHYDAYKLSVSSSGVVNNTVNLYSTLNGINYSIQANPMPVENDTIPLMLTAPVGNHVLDFSDDTHLTDEFSFYLIDRFTNTTTNLKKLPVYQFSVTSDAASYQNRFFVVFNYKENKTAVDNNPNPDITAVDSPEESSEITVYPNPVTTGSIQVTLTENITGILEISIVDAQGILVHSEKRESASALTITVQERLKSGMYMLIVQSEGKQFRKKIIAQ